MKQLGEQQFATLAAEGAAMTYAGAVDFVLAEAEIVAGDTEVPGGAR